MAYTKQSWTDTSSGGTSLSAARMSYIEDGIEAAAADADSAQADATTAIADAAAAQADADAAQADAATAQSTASAAVAKATVDAKGDLLVGSADNTVARLPVGADARFLEGDSAQATGIKWGRKISSASSAPAGATTGDIWIDRTNQSFYEHNGTTWIEVANLASGAAALPASLQTQSFTHAANGGVTIDLASGHTAQITLTANITAAHTLTGIADGDIVSVYYLASGASRNVDFTSMTEVAVISNPGNVTIAQDAVHRATFVRAFGVTYLFAAEAVA